MREEELLLDPWLRELRRLFAELEDGCHDLPVRPVLILRDALLGLSSVFFLVQARPNGDTFPYWEIHATFHHFLALWSHHTANLHSLVAPEGAHAVLLVERCRTEGELRRLQQSLQEIFSSLGLGSSLLWQVDAHFVEVPNICFSDTWEDLADKTKKTDGNERLTSSLVEWLKAQEVEVRETVVEHWLCQLLGQHLPTYRRWIVEQPRSDKKNGEMADKPPATVSDAVKEVRNYGLVLQDVLNDDLYRSVGERDQDEGSIRTAWKRMIKSLLRARRVDRILNEQVAQGHLGVAPDDDSENAEGPGLESFPSSLHLLDLAAVVIPSLMKGLPTTASTGPPRKVPVVQSVQFLESRLRRHQLAGVRLPMAPLTLVTGLNRGGKSTISQALSLALHNCFLAPTEHPFVLDMEPVTLYETDVLRKKLADPAFPSDGPWAVCRYLQPGDADKVSERPISAGLVLRWLITPGLLQDRSGKLSVFSSLVLHLLFPEEQGWLDEAFFLARRAAKVLGKRWGALDEALKRTSQDSKRPYPQEWQAEPFAAIIRRPLVDVLVHLLLALLLFLDRAPHGAGTERKRVGRLLAELVGGSLQRLRELCRSAGLQATAQVVVDMMDDHFPSGPRRPDSLLLVDLARELRKVRERFTPARDSGAQSDEIKKLLVTVQWYLQNFLSWREYVTAATCGATPPPPPDPAVALDFVEHLNFSLWEGTRTRQGDVEPLPDRPEALIPDLLGQVRSAICALLPAFWLRDSVHGLEPGSSRQTTEELEDSQLRTIVWAYNQRKTRVVERLLEPRARKTEGLRWLQPVFHEVHHLLLQYTWNWNRHRVLFTPDGTITLQGTVTRGAANGDLKGADVLNTADLVTAFYALTLSIFLLEPGASGRVLVVDDLLSALDPVQARSLLAGLERLRRGLEILAVHCEGGAKIRAQQRWIEIGATGKGSFLDSVLFDKREAVVAPQLVVLDSREEILWETAEWAGVPLTMESTMTLQRLLWSGLYRTLEQNLEKARRDFESSLNRTRAGRPQGSVCEVRLPTWLEVKPYVFPGWTQEKLPEDRDPGMDREVLLRMVRELETALESVGWMAGGPPNPIGDCLRTMRKRLGKGGESDAKVSEYLLRVARGLACWLRDWDLLPFALPDMDHVLYPAGVALYRLPEPWPAQGPCPGGAAPYRLPRPWPAHERREAALQGGNRVRRPPSIALTLLLALLGGIPCPEEERGRDGETVSG